MIGAWTAHLWQSTLFVLAAGALALAFRGNRAKVRYGLWLCASLKFLVPFALLIGLGSYLGWAPLTQQVARQIATPEISIAVGRIAQPFPESAPLGPAPDAVNGTAAMLGLWACGFAGIAAVRLRNWRRIRAAMRASTPLAIPAAVAIRSAPGLLEPGVVGCWRPVILLPEGILERLTPAQLEAVLAHELCHVRRHDNLLASIHMLVEAVFWFHPLVWWIGARLVEERERACDEGVLGLGNQPRTYADAIVSVCRLYAESPLACVAGVTGANLKRRIEAIMTNRTGQGLSWVKKALLAAAGVSAVAGPIAVGVLIGAGNAPAIHAQPWAVPAAAESPAPQDVAATAAPQDAPAQADNRYLDRRLVALLFDLDSMTADDQSRARKAAVDFVQGQMQSQDLVALMTANSGAVKVVEDFTDDRTKLQSSIGGIGAASGSAPGTSAQMERLATATRMLGALSQKKALVYFASGIERVKAEEPGELQEVIDTAVKSNVAFYPVDTHALVALLPPALPTSGGGRGMSAGPVQAGVSQDEYNRRVIYAKEHYTSDRSAMGRTYVRYGAPDQIEDRGAAGQVWRYNYLETFHSNVELEFAPGQRSLSLHVNWPPPVATFTGVAAAAAIPGGHASIASYPAGESQELSVPLGSLSGQVEIGARVHSVGSTGGGMVAGLGDKFEVKDPSGVYHASFVLQAGSYAGDVTVKEQATGQTYTETIYFQVK